MFRLNNAATRASVQLSRKQSSGCTILQGLYLVYLLRVLFCFQIPVSAIS